MESEGRRREKDAHQLECELETGDGYTEQEFVDGYKVCAGLAHVELITLGHSSLVQLIAQPPQGAHLAPGRTRTRVAYTRVVTIMPRFVLVNHSPTDLEARPVSPVWRVGVAGGGGRGRTVVLRVDSRSAPVVVPCRLCVLAPV